jgi:tripartite-type tricarboxylate transporter receptor subunit TctC
MKKLLLTILFFISTAVLAWQPTKPITVVTPNAPGAGNEIAFRILSKQVSEKTGATFVHDYRPGADGNIAMNHFHSAAADGYTVAIPSCQSAFVTSEIWYPQTVKFNPMEWEPVTNMGKSPLAFYARSTTDIDTAEKLIKEIQNGRRDINFAVGGAAHKLAVEYLVAGIKPSKDTVQTIMYKGPAQAMQDVLSGQVEFGVFPIAVGAPLVQAGKIKVIGIAGEKVLPGLEKYKLMNTYVTGLNVYACWNLMLPKNTPQEIQDWYHANFVPAINSKETIEQYKQLFIFTTQLEQTPEGVRAAMHRLREKWQPFARKIKPE